MGSKLIIATVIVQNSSTVTLSSRVEKKIKGNHKHLSIKLGYGPIRQRQSRDVTTGSTGATAVAPKFLDTLTLSQPRGADSAHHYRGHS